MSRQGLEASGTGALRELVIEVLERMERDGSAALERACAEHPELAESLRARVESLRELGLVGDLVEGPGGRVGEFRLLERVGAGGMGVVYRARQASLDREVALKLIRPELLFDDETRERFARETSVVARLQHPGIVPIYTVGERGDQPWYAMELVVGCSLAEALREFSGRSVDELSGEDLRDAVCERSSTPRPANLAPLFAGSWVESSLRVVRQAAEALAHAHQRGVLHRDVKASNLMLTPTGRVMLLDFGLSHVEGDDSLTRSGDRVGSVPYMPPELLRDGPRAVDRRSDVYGLGVILYELLTLHRPFAAEGVTELMAAILEGRPPRPSSYSPGLSWEQETVCLAALELDPRRRYATADDLARDLENVLERRPIRARRASLALVLRRLVQRRPGAAAAVGLAVLLPTVIASLSLREARNVGAALEKADEHRERALRAVDRMLYDVANARLAHVPQAHELRQNLYEDARELFEEMAVAEPDNGELRLMAVEAALGQATLLENEGRFAASEELLRGTLVDLVPWVAQGSFEARRARAEALIKLAFALREQSRESEAAELHAESFALLDELVREAPRDGEIAGMWIATLAHRAVEDWEAGRVEGVGERLELAESEARALLERDPEHGTPMFAQVLDWRAWWCLKNGRPDTAAALYQEALEHLETALAADEYNQRMLYLASKIAFNLAMRASGAGRYAEAGALLERARQHIDWVADAFPEIARYEEHRHRVEGRLQAIVGRGEGANDE